MKDKVYKQKMLDKMQYSIILLIGVFTLTSCFKDYNEDFLIKQKTVEFEDAAVVTSAAGKNYPILPSIFAVHGVVSYRINMFGEQSPTSQEIRYRIVNEETTAVEGRDFRFLTDNSVSVPPNASFGYLQVEVLPSIEGGKLLVVELLGNDEVVVSPAYKTIGIPMSNAVVYPDPAVVVDQGDYLHITELTLGGDVNPDLGCFLDMQTGEIYNWEAAALFSEKATIAYFHSAGNFANILFPALSDMATRWNTPQQPYYTRILNWSVAPNGTVVRYTNISTTEEDDLFNDLASAADIETTVLDAQTNLSSRPGHATGNTYGPGDGVRAVKTGDIVFVHSFTHDFYAVIRVLEAIPDGSVPGAQRTIKIEYKVQK